MNAPARAKQRIRMRCPRCGSEAICKDAWAAWNETTQKWELGGVYDHETCIHCEAEGDDHFDRIDIATGLKTGIELDEGLPERCRSGEGHQMAEHPDTGTPYCTQCCPLEEKAEPTENHSTDD